MISGGIELHEFAHIRLLLRTKLCDDPLVMLHQHYLLLSRSIAAKDRIQLIHAQQKVRLTYNTNA